MQTLLRCTYSPRVQPHASPSVRTLEVPNTGSHTIVWTLLLGLLCLTGYEATRISRKGQCSAHRLGAHDYSINFVLGFLYCRGQDQNRDTYSISDIDDENHKRRSCLTITTRRTRRIIYFPLHAVRVIQVSVAVVYVSVFWSFFSYMITAFHREGECLTLPSNNVL